jgi:hypothetical protein
MAAGGPPPLGAPMNLMEMGIGPGGRFDPHRDVLVFWPQMVAGIIHALRNRTIPRIAYAFEKDPTLEHRTSMCLLSLVTLFKESPPESYDKLMDNWRASNNDTEASDLLMMIFGRALLNFYVECVLNSRSPVGERWSSITDVIMNRILADPEIQKRLKQRSELKWYQRLFPWSK